jgi:hypothetical protein
MSIPGYLFSFSSQSPDGCENPSPDACVSLSDQLYLREKKPDSAGKAIKSKKGRNYVASISPKNK